MAHSASKITLSSNKTGTLGNGTVVVSATPFALRDTIQYQINSMGDYVQETN